MSRVQLFLKSVTSFVCRYPLLRYISYDCGYGYICILSAVTECLVGVVLEFKEVSVG